MSTQIQFLRTDQPGLRPDPNVLANGMPLLNFHESEPGLFFKARDGSLFKVGPTAVGVEAPNTGETGYPGNTVGEMWLDTGGAVPELRVFDGSDWVVPGADDTRVSSVGLTMPASLFEVENTPITTAGTLEVNLLPQVRNTVLAGPQTGSAQLPTFRQLVGDDIPGLDASKVVSGILDQARVPSLSAQKITTGVLNQARIPGIDATKIVSGTLPASFGGTGLSALPTSGELLIGTASGTWAKSTLTGAGGVRVTNNSGSISLSIRPPGPGNGEVLFNNSGTLSAGPGVVYDGDSNTLILTGDISVGNNLQVGLAASFNGTVNCDGVLTLGEVSGAPGEVSFVSGGGGAVTIEAPTSAPSSPTFRLPGSVPSSSTDKAVICDNFGQLAVSDTFTLETLALRTSFELQDQASGNAVTVEAPALAGDLTLTLPASYGTGGYAAVSPSGAVTVTDSLQVQSISSAAAVEAPAFRFVASSPAREFVTGADSLTVSSDGTYTLLDVPCDGSPGAVHFTVFVHDEDATAGTATLTQTFSAHFDGAAAAISAGSDKVDSWSSSPEPTFAATVSGNNLRVTATTASGSNTLNFMVSYSYVVNVTPP